MEIERALAARDQRLGYLGCECASCSTIAMSGFGLDGREWAVGRQDNPVHYYLSMRAYAADRIGGGGMGSYAFEFYCTCIGLVMKWDRFNTGWDFDDEYVVEMRTEAFQLAISHGFLPDLGYEFQLEAAREYLKSNTDAD